MILSVFYKSIFVWKLLRKHVVWLHSATILTHFRWR